MSAWRERARDAGLSEGSAALAATHFETVSRVFAAERGSGTPPEAWWIPGRIEVLGKHTDYGGGRSLLCAVERGFHVLAAPRDDAVVRIVDASTRGAVTIPFHADAPPRPGHWTDYPITVVRRIARDFPGTRTGIDLVMRSSLPSASGLSSSSALVIAVFLPLASINRLDATAPWRAAMTHPDALAEYLGAMENGRAFGAFAADHGVGTQGGSEDQTAILRARPGSLLQYHFTPVTHEATIPLPAGWSFVVAMSGVHAAKGAAVQARYNALAAEVAALLSLWRDATGRHDASLFAALQSAPDATDRLAALVAERRLQTTEGLVARLRQFDEETAVLIPAVAGRLLASDVPAIGEFVARSQFLAETVLRNQVPETSALAELATATGAVAASAFGAGFGGSVWALVRDADAEAFRVRWRSAYLRRFPHRRARAEFFLSRPGPPATRFPP